MLIYYTHKIYKLRMLSFLCWFVIITKGTQIWGCNLYHKTSLDVFLYVFIFTDIPFLWPTIQRTDERHWIESKVGYGHGERMSIGILAKMAQTQKTPRPRENGGSSWGGKTAWGEIWEDEGRTRNWERRLWIEYCGKYRRTERDYSSLYTTDHGREQRLKWNPYVYLYSCHVFLYFYIYFHVPLYRLLTFFWR